MAKVTVKWTRFAENCLNDVYTYLIQETASQTIAKKLVLGLIQRTEQLKKYPNSGRLEPLLKHLHQNHRYLVEGNYKIIYRYNAVDGVIVTDVFHTKQNPIQVNRKKGK